MQHYPGLPFFYDPKRTQEARRAINITPNKAHSIHIAEKGRADFVYNTAFLELNPLTFPEVQNEALECGKFRSSKVFIAGTEYEVPDAEHLPNIFNLTPFS